MAVIISRDFVITGALNEQPLTHARIGYRTIWRDSNAAVTASTSANNYPAIAAATENTYERWRPTTVPATWEVSLPNSRRVDYCGIAAHDLSTQLASVEIQYYDGSQWVEIDSTFPSDNTTLMFLFSPVNASRFRIRVTGGVPTIGVIFFGETLKMQRPIYGGHSPLNLSRNTDVVPNRSEGGQYIGRSVIRRGLSTSFRWSNLEASWYRAYFDRFVRYATQGPGPFFIAWRPETFPREVGYCWLSQSDITPSNSGTRNLMDVSMSVNAHVDRPSETDPEVYA